MVVDRRSDIHRNDYGDAASPAFSVVSFSSSKVVPAT